MVRGLLVFALLADVMAAMIASEAVRYSELREQVCHEDGAWSGSRSHPRSSLPAESQ
jgi:hypothetical protein